jgi:ketosteroid isomerase-like protein
MARVNGVWADDAVQEMPYAPAGFPSRVVGKEALVKQYAGWPQNAGKAKFTDGIRFYPTQNPQIVAVEFHGVSEIVTTGRSMTSATSGCSMSRAARSRCSANISTRTSSPTRLV